MHSKIGRFQIIRILGEGSQGVVYLAKDPLLERQVAIKTLHTQNIHSPQGQSFNDLLMDEAKVISKMTHPNIVSIFEAGQEGEMTFLVFEYIKGKTLTEIIKSREYQKVADALAIFRPLCEGILHSHQRNIIHGDLKPANIILDDNHIPKIMDFGIAKLLSNQKKDDNLYGTPRYMPPEYLKERVVGDANDVYALGLILYEIMTGEVAIQGQKIKQIVYNVFNQKIKLPSEFNKEVSEIFEHIIVKSTEKEVSNRFKSVAEILEAIDKFLSKGSVANQSSKAQDAAITFLMRKIKRQQDFPALSESLMKINSLVDKEDTNVPELANVIAEDFALTNKILKLVNSAYYRGSKPEVKTISQAILLLGFDEIRTVSMSLVLIEHLHNKAKAKKLKDHIVSSIYSGVLAKDLSMTIDLPQPEEAFLGGTFHQLGELLTLFYFHEEYDEISNLVKNERMPKEQASTQILGVSFERLAIEIAKEWKLPAYIIDNLKPYKPRKEQSKIRLNEVDKLRAVTTLSNELADVLNDADDPKWRHSAVGVWRTYADDLGLDDDSLKVFAENARQNLVDMNHIFNINLNDSEVIQKVKRLNSDEEEELQGDQTLIIEDGGEVTLLIESSVKKNPVKEILPVDVQLKNAIEAVKSEINQDNNLINIFNIIIESIYTALDLERAIIALFDKQKNEMRARIGKGISGKFLEEFNFSLKQHKDLFQISCVKGVDIFINDTIEFERKNNLPPWYRQIIDAETFMIFPITFRRKSFAIIYLDNNRPNELALSQDVLKLIQQLRSLCINSLEKKYSQK